MSREIVRRLTALKTNTSSEANIQQILRAAHKKMDVFLDQYQKNPRKSQTLGFLSQAVDGYIKVIEADPQAEKAYLALAFMAWKSKNLDDAYILLKTVLNINFTNTRAQSMLKRLINEQPDLDRIANQNFEKLLCKKTTSNRSSLSTPTLTSKKKEHSQLSANKFSFPTQKKDPHQGDNFKTVSFD